jgi:MEMO1 family protein
VPGIVAGALVAHPPILLPEVGGSQSERVRATAEAMRQLDSMLAAIDADTLVVVSPHGPSSLTSLPIRRRAQLSGDLGRFRAPQVRLEARVDTELVGALLEAGRRAGFALVESDDSELDHGVIVPLHGLPKTREQKRYVFLGISGWPLERFGEFGAWLHRQLVHRSAVLIASGDLSHRLTADAPYGFRSEGRVFDSLVVDALRDQDWQRIQGADPELIEEAGECGLRPLTMLLGAASEAGLQSRVLSYEGPFGVGYPVVAFSAAAPAFDIQDVGRRAIEAYLRHRQLIEPPQPIPRALRAPSALFITLRKDGELRGCVGSMAPTEPSAAHELIRYVVAAALRDPRFEPVRLEEVPSLSIKAQLLEPPEAITRISDLDPATYGIIVRANGRHALLLPDIEQITTAEEQVRAACDKAGIDRYAALRIERFRTRNLE